MNKRFKRKLKKHLPEILKELNDEEIVNFLHTKSSTEDKVVKIKIEPPMRDRIEEFYRERYN